MLSQDQHQYSGIVRCGGYGLLQGEALAPEEGLLAGFPAQEAPQQLHAVQRAAGRQDEPPVVQPRLRVQHALLGEPTDKG